MAIPLELRLASSLGIDYITSLLLEMVPILQSTLVSFRNYEHSAHKMVMPQGVLDWTRVAKTDLTHLSSQTWGMAEDYSSLIKSYGLRPPPEVLLTDCLGQMPSMCSLEGPWWRWATLASSLALKVKFAKCVLRSTDQKGSKLSHEGW